MLHKAHKIPVKEKINPAKYASHTRENPAHEKGNADFICITLPADGRFPHRTIIEPGGGVKST